jgi:transcriptional regulator with XRE-family HTH domain
MLAVSDDNLLGTFLKDRRAKLDPAAFGIPLHRRRTPGLRREEVAQRANVSATWYTWLEQGRGGAPSANVLDRIARALMLTDDEREHLFLLGLGRPPEVRYQAAEGVTPRLQRVLDALALSPAYVKNSTWDIVAWNRAASIVLADYFRRSNAMACASSSVIHAFVPRWQIGKTMRGSS